MPYLDIHVVFFNRVTPVLHGRLPLPPRQERTAAAARRDAEAALRDANGLHEELAAAAAGGGADARWRMLTRCRGPREPPPCPHHNWCSILIIMCLPCL